MQPKITLWIIVILLCSVNAFGQNAIISYKWKQPLKDATIVSDSDHVSIVITEIPKDSIPIFFKKTKIIMIDTGGKVASERTFYDILANQKSPDSAQVKINSLQLIKDFSLDPYLDTIRTNAKFVIVPYLGTGLKTISDTFDLPHAKVGPRATQPGQVTDCGKIFIPCPATEAQWMAQSKCCGYLEAPLLNKHTKWALTYDFSQKDPVAAWIRKNRFRAGGGGSCCTGITKVDDVAFSKNIQLSGIKKYRYALNLFDSLYRKTAKVTANAADARNEINDKKEEITEKRLRKVAKESDITYDKSADKIIDLAYRLYALQMMTGKDSDFPNIAPGPASSNIEIPMQTGYKTAGCCSQVYCAKQKARFSPTVDRDLLISVSNFHPYRDSFALSISYTDEFTEDAAIMVKAYNDARHATTVTDTSGATKTDKNKVVAAGDQASVFKTKIQILDDELDEFYKEKHDQYHLDIHVLDKDIAYIGHNIWDILSIQPNEAAINKKAAEIAATLPDDGKTKLLANAAHAGALLTKIQRYGIFDSKSIFIQNKDLVNIKFQRFSDGKLLTSDNEATRSYITRGGFKADFSVGLLGSNLINHAYTTIPVMRQDTFFHVDASGVIHHDQVDSLSSPSRRDSIVRNAQGKFNVLAAVMTHVYYRSGGYLNAGLSFGFSINQDAETRYIIGGSLMFMRTARIVVTGGAIMGKVKRLETGYSEGQVIAPLANSSAVPTKDCFKVGYFVGLSWNIAGFNIGGR